MTITLSRMTNYFRISSLALRVKCESMNVGVCDNTYCAVPGERR